MREAVQTQQQWLGEGGALHSQQEYARGVGFIDGVNFFLEMTVEVEKDETSN